MVNLRQLREEKDLTQLELGLEVGVTASAIQQYEAGTSDPSVKVLIALAEYFNVSLDYMMDLSSIREKPDTEENLIADRLKYVSNKRIRKAILEIVDEISHDK